MKWTDPNADGYSHFRAERTELRAINRLADKLDAKGFMEWLKERSPRDRIAIVCLLLGFGCEYNDIPEPVDSFPLTIQPIVEHMKATIFKISRTIGADQRFLFDHLRQLPCGDFDEAAEWAFLFYARNDNWRKFSDLQP